MTPTTRKTRWLAGAALTAGLTFIASAPASAQCTFTSSSRTCSGTFATSDTTGTGPTDRNAPYSTGAQPITFTISTGAVITGAGLAESETATGANPLTVVNNGSVSTTTALPLAGGSGALTINANGSTLVNYSGTGSVTNNFAGSGLEFLLSGTTASLNAQVGGNITTLGAAAPQYGVYSRSTATGGSLVTNILAGSTIRSNFGGVDSYVNSATSTATVSVTNNGTIAGQTANGLDYGLVGETDGLGAVTVTNNGLIGSATDRVSDTGVYAINNNAASTANVTVGGASTGQIWGSSRGIYAFNASSGTTANTGLTTVNYGGVINTTGGPGIQAGSQGGLLSVSSGAITATGGNGIDATTTTGNQLITNNGAITASGFGINATSTSGAITVTAAQNVAATGANAAISANSAGNRVVNVSSGATVNSATGTDIASTGAGTTQVNNVGTIGATGQGSAAIALSALTDGALTVNNNTGGVINGIIFGANGNDTINNAGIWTLASAGAPFLFDGNDVITNLNGGVINFNGAGGGINFGPGTDTFSNNAGATVNINGDTSFVALENFNQNGRINMAAGTTLTGPAAAFVNGSTGQIDTAGAATIGGFTSFSNAGTVDLAAGTFTVPVASFTNTGTVIADEGATTITGQTGFANSGAIDLQDGATGDFLTINSNYVGSGGSNLQIDSASTSSDRLIIGPVGGAASGSTLVNVNLLDNGFIDPTGQLVVDNVTSTASAFTLGTINNSPLLSYALVQRGADYYLVSAPTVAVFQPLSLASAASDMWYQSADEVIAQTRLPTEPEGWSIWGQIYASRDKFNGDNGDVTINGVNYDTSSSARNHRYGLQTGVDFGFGGGRIGVTGGYAKNKVSSAADLKIKGWNIGVYGQFGGLTGFHGEGLFKYDRYKVDVNDGAFAGDSSRLRSTGVDGALGYRFGLGGDASLDANVGLAHVWSKLGGIDNFGFNYDYSKITSTRGRAGLRAVFGSSWRPYVDATVLHEFDGKARVNLFDGVNNYDLDYSGKGTWVRLEAGLGGPVYGAGPILAAWADVGDKKGVGARLGFRFGGGRAVMAPPPPPPMAPPPPPAPPPPTQTCADGSVILATDVCPPPPPPPPPAPEPERG